MNGPVHVGSVHEKVCHQRSFNLLSAEASSIEGAGRGGLADDRGALPGGTCAGSLEAGWLRAPHTLPGALTSQDRAQRQPCPRAPAQHAACLTGQPCSAHLPEPYSPSQALVLKENRRLGRWPPHRALGGPPTSSDNTVWLLEGGTAFGDDAHFLPVLTVGCEDISQGL